jgi:cobalt-zinc-cadmium efflux system protein
MGHEHAGHHHAPSADADRRWLAVTLALIAGFMVVEVVAGLLSGSLTLLSDAAHMLTDTGSIGLALFAARLAARPPEGRYTFGLGRAEILSAQANGAALLVLAGVITVEALQRIGSSHHVDGAVVVAVGAIGLVVNLAAAAALSRSERQSMNVKGARAHVMADLYGSVAAIVAGVVLVAGGPHRIDAVAALTVAALMLRSGWGLLRDSGRVLLESAPPGLEPQVVGAAIAHADGVIEVHDLHVWEVTSGFPALSAHVTVASGDDCHTRRREIRQLLEDRFGISHVTLQVDHEPRRELLGIEPAATAPPPR